MLAVAASASQNAGNAELAPSGSAAFDAVLRDLQTNPVFRVYGPEQLLQNGYASPMNVAQGVRTWLVLINPQEDAEVVWLAMTPGTDGLAVRYGVHGGSALQRVWRTARTGIDTILPESLRSSRSAALRQLAEELRRRYESAVTQVPARHDRPVDRRPPLLFRSVHSTSQSR